MMHRVSDHDLKTHIEIPVTVTFEYEPESGPILSGTNMQPHYPADVSINEVFIYGKTPIGGLLSKEDMDCLQAQCWEELARVLEELEHD